jgi:MSHA biogenesis protein MshQ
LLIVFAAVYATHAQAVITLRGAEQNAITSATPPSAISHIGAGSSQGIMGCGNINPSIPAGNVGDLLIALAMAKEDDGGNTVTMAGWNTYYTAEYPGNPPDNNEMQVHIFWRFATGGDPNTINQSGSACNSFGGQISRFRGVDTLSPFETVTPGVVTQDSGNLDTGSITTTSSTAMLLVAGFVSDNRNVAQGGGWSQSFDFAYGNRGAKPDFDITLNYQAQTSVGAKSISNWDLQGGGNDENFGVILALTPAAGAGGGGLTINVPAGTTTGDVMVAAISVRPSTVSILAPAGWTSLIRTNQGAGNSNAQEIFYRAASGTEPASYEWNFVVAITGAAGGIVTYTGTDLNSPFDAFAGNTTPNGTSHQANSITTTVANTMVISTHSFSSSMPWSPPAGMSENVDIASLAIPNAAGITLEMNEVAQAVAGATGNKVATITGNSDTGVAHLLALREPVLALQYLAMDEAAWAGAGSVLDGSGNGNNGSPLGGAIPANPASSPALAGDPGTCGYGDIPSNTNDNVDAIDSNFTPGNTGTITFWFNNKSDWDANGDRLLFDASNNLGDENADKHFFLVRRNNNNGSLRFVVEDTADNRFQATATNQTFAAGAWVHIAVTWDLPNDLVEIYVNGALQDTDTAGSNGTMGNINDLYIGDNRSTGTGGNSWSNDSANGYIDEFRIYNSVVSAAQITADMAARHACITTDHFDINHDTTAINCQAEPITIEAHMADHLVDTTYTGTLNLSTSTGNGDWTIITGLGVLNNGVVNDGIATYGMVAGDLGVVVLGLKDTTVETVNINVTDGTISEITGTALASEDQNLDFAQSGFVFLADTVASSIGTQIGGKASNVLPGSQVLELQAVTTGPVGACEAALVGVNQIELAFECRNPVTCTAQVNIDGGTPTNIAGNPLAGVVTYTPVNLDFGIVTDSTATFVMNYPDVGEIQLYARYNLGPLPAINYMSGNSNAFVERPFGFNVVVAGNPGATTPAGAVFTQAGADFTTTVTAVLYQAGDDTNNDGVPDNHGDTDPSNNASLSDNTAALNYGQEVATENVVLSALLNQPGGGNDPGLLGGTTLTSFTNGVASSSTVRYDEVGIIEIAANVADGTYLGVGNILGKSGYVGRFYPNNFVIANPVLTNRSDIGACADPFTYMAENYQITYDLQAHNAQVASVVTQNYIGAFAKLDPTVVGTMGFGATNDSITDLSARLGVGLAGAFAAGVAPVTATINVARDPVPTTLDGPFNTFQVGIAPADSDAVTLLPVNLNLALVVGLNTHGLLGQTDIRYGRLNLQNNFGSELLPLTMPLSTEYYQITDTEFVTNVDDNCTTITTADVLLYNDQVGNKKVDRVVGATTIEIVSGGATTTLDPIPAFVAGQATMTFSAPGVEGHVDVEVQTPFWLLSDLDGIDQGIEGPGMHCNPALNGSGDPAEISGPPAACVADLDLIDDIPLSRGNFGIFKGSDNIIYIREVVGP